MESQSPKTSASFKKALAFGRAFLEASASGTLRGADCLAAHGGDRRKDIVHTTGTRSRSNREADGGYPGACRH